MRTLSTPILKLLSLTLFLTPLFLLAQQSAYTLVFQITADEAETLYQYEPDELYSDPYLYQLIDSFQQSSPSLPVGHYLFVKAVKEELEIKQHSVHQHDVILQPGTNELRLEVYDTSGQNLDSGYLVFNEQSIPWEKTLQLYRQKRTREDGWLRVELPGDTLFYKVEHSKIKPQRKNFFRTPFGYIISTPYRWAKNTYKYFKRGFKRNNWHLNWQNIWPFPQKSHHLKGYIALSQPRYRPGDTMRVKVYLTKRNGKPWKGPIKMELLGHRNQKVVSRELLPDRPGAFSTEVVLADTLKLDQYYRLNFFVPGDASKYGYKNERFLLEDYQLEAATFTFRSPKKEYRSGTPILFDAEAKDQNGNSLAGASVELIALRANVIAIGPDSLLIPDTLWTHRQDLSLREDAKIRFPDSLLPPADLGILVQAFFATAGGESEKKTANFNYYYQEGEIDYELKDGEWIFRYLNGNSSLTQNVTLVTHRNFLPYRDTLVVRLPYRIPVNPNVGKYILTTPSGTIKTVQISRQPKPVAAIGQHLGDSLILRLDNPHGLNVRYQLHAGNNLMLERETTDHLLLQQKASSGALYQLSYQYVWAGITQTGTQSFRTYKNQLQFNTELPDKIYPGQTVQVKIKATDHKARAAKGVEMVAGAINSQFNSREHLTPPQITYKNKKGRRLKHRYAARRVGNQHISPISKKWYQHLSLDTMLYYNIRYPEKGVFTQMDTITSDSFYYNNPQVSPYVVKDGKLQSVYLVYLNRRLVYSHLSEDDNPYAFTARPGYNQLQIRTLEAEYRIDSVWIEPGHKLSFSLDDTYYGSAPDYGRHIKRTSAPDYLTGGEVALLNQKMLVIRKEEKNTVSYLSVDSTRIYQWNSPRKNGRNRTIGPVLPNQKLAYVQRDGLENTFLYEPGYLYEIREGRERLYSNRLLNTNKRQGLVKKLPHPKVDQFALIPNDIIKTSPEVKEIKFRRGWRATYSDEGAVQVLSDPPVPHVLAAISLQNINGNYSIYAPNQLTLRQIPQGYYELMLITTEGYTASRKCWIYPNQLQVLDFGETAFVQDTSLQVFDDLYTYYSRKPSFTTFPRSSPGGQRVANPYEGIGHLASGILRDQENGEPLIGASILLVGSYIGTVTDIDGSWSLWVPDMNSELAFSYLGYQSTQMKASSAEEGLVLSLGQALDEVVITAYRVPLTEQDNTTQGGTLTSDQIRSLPTRKINALAATTAGIRMVDDGDMINVRGSRDDVTNYYVDGVRVQGRLIPESEISLVDAGNPTMNLYGQGFDYLSSLPDGGLRTDFRDYGFWQPDLITDDRGEAYFQVTFPDDITSWQTYVLGMDDRKRGGVWHGETRAFQPVLAQLFLPRFLLPGDEIDLVGSSVNYTNDTFQIETQLEIDGAVVLKKSHQLTDGLTDEVNYTAIAGRDSLTAKYTLQTGNYLEGEERSIPLFRVGTEETIGGFHRLEGDTTLQLEFDPADGPVTIYAQPDLLHVMMNELEALIDYPYGCNEQSASRLLALLMQKEVYELTERTFEHEKAIQKMIALLRQRQLPDGSWGWWGGSPRNQWMTIYVLRALHTAKEAGYATEAYEKGLLFLTNQLSRLTGVDRLQTIALFSDLGQNMDYTSLLEPYDSLAGLNWTTLTTTLIQVQQGLPYQLDTLNKYQQETLFGGHYWGQPDYGFYRNAQQYGILAYRIQQAAGNQDALAPIRQYFTEQRHRTPSYHWRAGFRNTFEAAMILRTILPVLLQDYGDQTPPDFQQRIEIIADNTITWDTLPQQITLTTNKPISLRKTGVGTTYFTAYQRRWNEQPERVEGPFVVTSELWQGGKTTKRLAASRPAQLKVEVVVEKSSDYILLEVPIPAGCSYGSKPQNSNYYRSRSQETYREYNRDKVAIFCEHLEPGIYTYTVDLEPRFTGRFQLNPAKAEQMYFPIFYGREGMRAVKIE